MDDEIERSGDRLDCWADGGSVQIIAIASYGDPVDCSPAEARRFAERILEAADRAERA